MALTLEITEPHVAPRRVTLTDDSVILGRSAECSVQLEDRSVSRHHASITRRGNGIYVRDLRSANGTFVDGQKVDERPLRSGDRLRLGDVWVQVFSDENAAQDDEPAPARMETGRTTRIITMRRPKSPAASPADPDGGAGAGDEASPVIVGASAHIEQLRRLIQTASTSDLPVLVRGETGTGKELVARNIAEHSRHRRPLLVAVSVPSLDKNLASSELFGHVRGAFTGAHEAREGWFELADGATLLLDEIGDADRDVQAKLLRVLEESEIVPVGSRKPKRVDVRVIAATNRPLEQMVERGQFFGPLYYRLCGMEIVLEPLRQQPEDIPLLVEHFARIASPPSSHPGDAVAPEVMDAFLSHPWLGNVRELRYCVEHALLLSGGGRIELRHLSQKVREACNSAHDGGRAPTLYETRRRRLVEALRASQGNQSLAAKELGVTRQAVNQLVKTMGIRAEEWQS